MTLFFEFVLWFCFVNMLCELCLRARFVRLLRESILRFCCVNMFLSNLVLRVSFVSLFCELS